MPSTIKEHLKTLNITAWDWAGEEPGKFRNSLIKRNPRIRPGAVNKGALFDKLSEYCWCAYEKAFQSAGALVIGRVHHLNAADL